MMGVLHKKSPFDAMRSIDVKTKTKVGFPGNKYAHMELETYQAGNKSKLKSAMACPISTFNLHEPGMPSYTQGSARLHSVRQHNPQCAGRKRQADACLAIFSNSRRLTCPKKTLFTAALGSSFTSTSRSGRVRFRERRKFKPMLLMSKLSLKILDPACPTCCTIFSSLERTKSNLPIVDLATHCAKKISTERV